jgi:hypothetical protein
MSSLRAVSSGLIAPVAVAVLLLPLAAGADSEAISVTLLMLSMSAAKLSRSSLPGAGGTPASGSFSWACNCLIMRSSIILILHSMTL